MWFRKKKDSLPLPPLDLRKLVGPTEDRFFDNPEHQLVFPDVPIEAYDFVFDFGCGCGRIARQLIQQNPRPRRYVGIDLHRGMIEWCRQNLAPFASGFEFHHHNVRNIGLNPNGKTDTLPLSMSEGVVTLFLAWSVFTHVVESQAVFYLNEVARVLDHKGIAITTWFLFDKADFPMMQEFQNALFINDTDPTNAVIFDKTWLRNAAAHAGLLITQITPPAIRGFQWVICMTKAQPGKSHADFPEDVAPRGVERPPLMPKNAAKLGFKNGLVS